MGWKWPVRVCRTDVEDFRELYEVPKIWSELKDLRGDFKVPDWGNMG